MKQEFFSQHWVDGNGNPAGGVSSGLGFAVSWQNGPLAEGATRKEPNGCFVETLIVAAIDRITFYQGSRFNCRENALALEHLKLALGSLEARTANRELRGVEGTHKV